MTTADCILVALLLIASFAAGYAIATRAANVTLDRLNEQLLAAQLGLHRGGI